MLIIVNLGIVSANGDFHTKQRAMVRQLLTKVSWDQSSAAMERVHAVSEELVQWLSDTGGNYAIPLLAQLK